MIYHICDIELIESHTVMEFVEIHRNMELVDIHRIMKMVENPQGYGIP